MPWHHCYKHNGNLACHTLSGCIFHHQDLQILGCIKALNATSNDVGLAVDHNFLREMGKVNLIISNFFFTFFLEAIIF